MDIATTGIEGLDNILQGGFKRPGSIIVSGLPGTGKTVFIMQGVYKAASQGEKVCVFLYNNSKPLTDIQQSLSKFDFYDHQLHEQGLVNVYSIDLETQSDGGINYIAKVFDDTRPDRIVIDYTALQQYGYQHHEIFIKQVSDLVKSQNALAYFALNLDQCVIEGIPVCRYGDEVFHLSNDAEGSVKSRFIDVIKSHALLYTNQKYSLAITSDGMVMNMPISHDITEVVNTLETIRKRNRVKIVIGAGGICLGLILLTIPSMIMEGYNPAILAVLGAISITGGIYIFASPKI